MMLLETFIRASAIGVGVGAVVAFDMARITPELAAAPAKAALIAGPVVLTYVVPFWGIALALLGGVALLSRFGIPAERFLSARVLWTIGISVLLLAVLNEAARGYHVLEPWKRPIRAVGGLIGLAVVVSGLVRPVRTSRWVRILERGLASGVLVAGAGAALYFGSFRTGGTAAAPSPGMTRTPYFEPEPEEVLRPAREGTGLRVLVIGLDGASWNRIHQGIERGDLPTFARLVQGGLTAPLRSLVPTYSPPIWTTIMTGVSPEEHGIEDFYLTQVPRIGLERFRMRRAADLAEEVLDGIGELRRVPVTSTLRRRKAIWNLADEAGLRSGVLGLWATWPPEPLTNGFVVSDHASLARRYEWLHRRKVSSLESTQTMHPGELEERLAPFQRSPESVTREELAQFVAVDDTLWEEFQETRSFSKAVPLSAFRSTFLNDAFFFDSGHLLFEEERPDLLVVYGKAIDELSHFFYQASMPEAALLGWSAQDVVRFGRAVDRAYAWTDARIAPLVDAVEADGNTLLIVVSDHGWAKEADGGYNHNDGPPGILILYGAGVCRERCPEIDDPSVFDVAPTVLERLRLPLSDELVGRPWVEAFQAENPRVSVARYGAARHAAKAVPSGIDPELNEMLEALGYVE
jgi:hypothetical protein